MTTYTIKAHDVLPIIIGMWHEDFVFKRDANKMSLAMREILNQQKSPVYYLLDVSNWHDLTFNQLMSATSVAARGKDANFHHSMNLATLIITNEPIVAQSALGMRSDVFGNANVYVFQTQADAIEFVKISNLEQ